MTCIIAHRDGWMAADRRSVFQGSLIGPYRVGKITRGPGLLVATAGNIVLRDLVEDALAGAETTRQGIEAIRRMFLEKEREGHALVLTQDRLFEVLSTGACVDVDQHYWAIGSGYLVSLGWLGAISQRWPLDAKDAEDAIGLAAKLVNDVGDGVQVEYL